MAENGVDLKYCEKIDKYVDLVIEMRKMWNMKMIVLLVVSGVRGTVPKSL